MKCKFCGRQATGGISYTAPGNIPAFTCWECKEYYILDCKTRKNEELQKLELLNVCSFDLAWIGKCKKPGYPFCNKHKKEVCRVCGRQATHQCSVADGLVCGIPLCDECKCPNHRDY